MKLIVITYLIVLLCPTLLFGQDESIQEQSAQNYHRVGVVVMPHIAWQNAITQMYTFGISYERKTTKRIGFEADLLYSYYVGHLICDSIRWIDFGTAECIGNEKEKIHFLSIPLITSVTLNNNPKKNINIIAGIQPGILMKGLSKIDKANNYPEFYIAHFITGIGANYKLSEKYSLKGQVRIEMSYVAFTLGMLIGMSYNF